MEAKTTRNRKKQIKRMRRNMLLVAIAVLAVIYVIGFVHYRKHFLPGTELNGVKVSGMTADETEQCIKKEIDAYALTLVERDGATETINGRDINLQAVFNGEVAELISDQNSFAWIVGLFGKKELTANTLITYDEAAFNTCLTSLKAMDESSRVEPQDATVSEYSATEGYTIVPEVYGNRLLAEVFTENVQNAVLTLNEELNLDEAGCYKNPLLYSDDEALETLVANMNKYVNMTITYDLGDTTEVIDGNVIKDWLVIDGTDVSISRDAVSEYTVELATKYNTAFHQRFLDTSYGKTVEIVGGDYGWKVDKEAELNQIIADIEGGVDVTREMNFSQTANSHGENDYGDSYVEINLTAQHLYLYSNGEMVLDTDFVSGNISKGNGTPTGAYGITYKERDATLNGENYSTPVS